MKKQTIPALEKEQSKLIKWLKANVNSPDFFEKSHQLSRVNFKLEKLSGEKAKKQSKLRKAQQVYIPHCLIPAKR